MQTECMSEVESWRYPLLSYYLKVQKEASRKMRSIPSMNFTGDDEEDWELIVQHINFLIDFHSGITVHASNNQLSELAIKINQAVTNRQLTITQQTINAISGPVGFTTADSVVAGYHPELVKLDKTNT